MRLHLNIQLDDLLFGLERQLSIAHVEKQHTERPNGRSLRGVRLRLDVLGRFVLASAVKVGVDMVGRAFSVDSRGAEVDKNELHGGQIDKQVLGFEIAVDDAVIEQLLIDSHELCEEVARFGLGQPTAVLRLEVVEQVHAVVQLGHDNHPLVLLLEELVHLDDSGDLAAHLVEENLGRVFLVVHHEPVFRLVFRDQLDDHLFPRLSRYSLVDFTESAVSDVLAEFVVAQIGLAVEFEALRVLDELVFDVV